jgi:hypothetical protein
MRTVDICRERQVDVVSIKEVLLLLLSKVGMMIHTAPEVFAMRDARRYEQGGWRKGNPKVKHPLLWKRTK